MITNDDKGISIRRLIAHNGSTAGETSAAEVVALMRVGVGTGAVVAGAGTGVAAFGVWAWGPSRRCLWALLRPGNGRLSKRIP